MTQRLVVVYVMLYMIEILVPNTFVEKAGKIPCGIEQMTAKKVIPQRIGQYYLFMTPH